MLITNFLLISFAVAAVSAVAKLAPQENHRMVKSLLENYDNGIRPTGVNGSGPVVVSVNMYIRSLSLDVQAMTLKNQLTFRMQWVDPRLSYSSRASAPTYLTVPRTLEDKMWLPDIFFSNEKEYKTHDGLMENSFYRIFPNGEVLYSTRISLQLSCPMMFRSFPFSKQTCNMRMASYGHTTEDIVFNWKASDPMQITHALHLPRMTLIQYTTDYCTSQTNTGTYSCLLVDLQFHPEVTPYIRDVYAPMVMSLVLIWLSMFLSPVDNLLSRLTCFWAAAFYCKWTSYSPLVATTLAGVINDTAFDCWNFWCNIFLLLTLFQVILANRLGSSGGRGMMGRGSIGERGAPGFMKIPREKTWGDKIDFGMKIAYPVLLAFFVFVYFMKYKDNELEG